MDASVTFFDLQSGEMLHGINCDCGELETAYAAGKEIQIKEIPYIIDHNVRCINGHVSFKVYLRKKSAY